MACPVSGMEWTSAFRSTIAVITGPPWRVAGLRMTLQRYHVPKLPGARGVPQLGERLGLDLADALPGEGDLRADLLEGAGLPREQAEAQRQNLLLPVGERVEHPPEVLLAQRERSRLEGALGLGVLDEVAQLGVLVPDGLVDRDRLGQDAEGLPDLVRGHLGGSGDLVDGRLTAEGLDELGLHLAAPVQGLDPVHP